MGTIVGPAVAVMLTMNGLAAGIVDAAEPAFGPVLDLPLEGKQVSSSRRTMPSDGEMAQGYPQLAQMLGIEGRAAIVCESEIDGRVDGCRILSEAPSGLGFGAATQRAAAYFTRIRPRLTTNPSARRSPSDSTGSSRPERFKGRPRPIRPPRQSPPSHWAWRAGSQPWTATPDASMPAGSLWSTDRLPGSLPVRERNWAGWHCMPSARVSQTPSMPRSNGMHVTWRHG